MLAVLQQGMLVCMPHLITQYRTLGFSIVYTMDGQALFTETGMSSESGTPQHVGHVSGPTDSTYENNHDF